jgi:pimeloyl-ACP methyl ester carboxylesterase
MDRHILNKTITIDGIDIFYREAGDKKKPRLLLLHGFPTSSVMFKQLMLLLCDKFYLVAPDYPGFGFSGFPSKGLFRYTFENIALLMSKFTQAINLNEFTVYLHDYGCPIGLRLCMRHPEKIEGIIVQNGNAYREGIGPQWDETIDYWENPTEEKKKKVSAFLSEEGTKMQYTAGVPEHLLSRLSPDAWTLDWQRMCRAGNVEMQFELNCDFKSNMQMYPAFQAYFREYQPRALIVWGKYDVFFNVDEAFCYQRDLHSARVHILECGHMALETNVDEIVQLIRNFMTPT